MEIALEAIPRSAEELRDSAACGSRYREITALNVPDQFRRFPLRSWEACEILNEHRAGRELIPHFRAIDFNVNEPFPHAETIRRLGIRTVLVITGDPSKEPVLPEYPTTAIQMIGKLKRELPGVQVLAAFDPYRNNIRYELDYLREKEAAGADGFMSQPFFDLRLLEIYAEYLEGRRVYWGISPVVSEKSRAYWETRNRAIFPKGFQPTLDWNVRFGRAVHAFCERNDFDFYLMPMKLDLPAYLAGLFGEACPEAR